MHDDEDIGYSATPPAGDPTATPQLLKIRIKATSAEVVIDFGMSLSWIALEPEEARTFAIGIFNCAAAVQGHGPVIDTIEVDKDAENG